MTLTNERVAALLELERAALAVAEMCPEDKRMDSVMIGKCRYGWLLDAVKECRRTAEGKSESQP